MQVTWYLCGNSVICEEKSVLCFLIVCYVCSKFDSSGNKPYRKTQETNPDCHSKSEFCRTWVFQIHHNNVEREKYSCVFFRKELKHTSHETFPQKFNSFSAFQKKLCCQARCCACSLPRSFNPFDYADNVFILSWLVSQQMAFKQILSAGNTCCSFLP